MKSPLVSIICLCYNQEKYVREAIESAINQDYDNLEIIVVDDGSTDESKSQIELFLKDHPEIQFIPLEDNVGNCKAFNMAFRSSKGSYLIDLACDDILLPNRVASGIDKLEKADSMFGVAYSDVELIDHEGKALGLHSDRYNIEMPEGDIYCNLIESYFVNAASMLMRREVLEELEGYDESLAYEDFDFWIRSARIFKYMYQPDVVVKKRLLKSAHSREQLKWRSKAQWSTYEVCRKIYKLNKVAPEDRALQRRLRYEMKQCFKTLNLDLLVKYVSLHRKVNQRRLS